MRPVTRFAPSPNGYLHLGHAWSALQVRQAAGPDGRFLLRIEDIDFERCKPEFEDAIYQDLAWLGFAWETPVRRQSEHLGLYVRELERLKQQGVVYPCFCSRKAVAAAQAAHPQPMGPEGPIYPGTCRSLDPALAAARLAQGDPHAWRLDSTPALRHAGTLHWTDRAQGRIEVDPAALDDVILARRDNPASYHLSVVADDAAQGITLVTRGMDLFGSTGIHRLLQALLGYETPDYFHHSLILDPATGGKLSKRNHSPSVRDLRDAGSSPEDIFSSLPTART